MTTSSRNDDDFHVICNASARLKALSCACLVCLLAACSGEKLVLGGDGDAGCMPGTYLGTYQCATSPDSSFQITGNGSISLTLTGDRGGPNLLIAPGTKVSSSEQGITTTSDLSGSLDCLTGKLQGTLSQVTLASLDEARAALVQHDAQRALDALEHHRRAFPRALLAEERDAMRVQALVAAGRYDEARARASAFRKSAHDSLFLRMVDAAIASIP